MPTGNLTAFLKDCERALGAENVTLVEETIKRYGEHTLPAADRRPGAVVYPGSTAEVQAVVRAANAHRVPIFPISTGNNMGLGTRAPVKPGQVVVVNNGEPDATRQWAVEIQARFPVLVQDKFSLSKRYQVIATPFAFLIDENGIITSKASSAAGSI